MKKRDLIIYTILVSLFSVIILMGAIMYFVKYEMVHDMFVHLGVPPEIIYPLAIAKILGIATIWLIKVPLLKQLAFLGFAIDLLLAIIAHGLAGDEEIYGPIAPLVLLIASYWFYRKTSTNTTDSN